MALEAVGSIPIRLPILLILDFMPRSSRGLGRRPFTAVARVQIPYAVHFMEPVAQSVRALVCGTRGRGFNSHQAPHFIDFRFYAAFV